MPGKAEWRIDGVLLGTLAGMAGALAKDAPNFILRSLGVLKGSYWEMAASTILAPEQAQTPGGLFIGAAADLFIGGVLGIIMPSAWWPISPGPSASSSASHLSSSTSSLE